MLSNQRFHLVSRVGVDAVARPPAPQDCKLAAEVLVGLEPDTTVYLSRRGEALKVNKLTFTIRASDSSWHPGLPGRPLFSGDGKEVPGMISRPMPMVLQWWSLPGGRFLRSEKKL